MKSILILYVIYFTLPLVIQRNISLDKNGMLNVKSESGESVVVDSKKIIAWQIINRVKKAIDDNQLTRDAYMREVNESIADYYAQRKAVMDRYHTRQREIAAKFAGRRIAEVVTTGATAAPVITTTSETTTAVMARTSEAPTTERNFNYNYGTIDESIRTHRNIQRDYVNGHSAGYYQLGSLRNTSNEELVYQHNLGVGISGQSELDAVVEVLLDNPIRITLVELIPYNNSRASLDHISGGPGYNNVKLKLTPQPNRGLSYTVKIWALKN